MAASAGKERAAGNWFGGHGQVENVLSNAADVSMHLLNPSMMRDTTEKLARLYLLQSAWETPELYPSHRQDTVQHMRSLVPTRERPLQMPTTHVIFVSTTSDLPPDPITLAHNEDSNTGAALTGHLLRTLLYITSELVTRLPFLRSAENVVADAGYTGDYPVRVFVEAVENVAGAPRCREVRYHVFIYRGDLVSLFADYMEMLVLSPVSARGPATYRVMQVRKKRDYGRDADTHYDYDPTDRRPVGTISSLQSLISATASYTGTVEHATRAHAVRPNSTLRDQQNPFNIANILSYANAVGRSELSTNVAHKQCLLNEAYIGRDGHEGGMWFPCPESVFPVPLHMITQATGRLHPVTQRSVIRWMRDLYPDDIRMFANGGEDTYTDDTRVFGMGATDADPAAAINGRAHDERAAVALDGTHQRIKEDIGFAYIGVCASRGEGGAIDGLIVGGDGAPAAADAGDSGDGADSDSEPIDIDAIMTGADAADVVSRNTAGGAPVGGGDLRARALSGYNEFVARVRTVSAQRGVDSLASVNVIQRLADGRARSADTATNTHIPIQTLVEIAHGNIGSGFVGMLALSAMLRIVDRGMMFREEFTTQRNALIAAMRGLRDPGWDEAAIYDTPSGMELRRRQFDQVRVSITTSFARGNAMSIVHGDAVKNRTDLYPLRTAHLPIDTTLGPLGNVLAKMYLLLEDGWKVVNMHSQIILLTLSMCLAFKEFGHLQAIFVLSGDAYTSKSLSTDILTEVFGGIVNRTSRVTDQGDSVNSDEIGFANVFDDAVPPVLFDPKTQELPPASIRHKELATTRSIITRESRKIASADGGTDYRKSYRVNNNVCVTIYNTNKQPNLRDPRVTDNAGVSRTIWINTGVAGMGNDDDDDDGDGAAGTRRPRRDITMAVLASSMSDTSASVRAYKELARFIHYVGVLIIQNCSRGAMTFSMHFPRMLYTHVTRALRIESDNFIMTRLYHRYENIFLGNAIARIVSELYLTPGGKFFGKPFEYAHLAEMHTYVGVEESIAALGQLCAIMTDPTEQRILLALAAIYKSAVVGDSMLIYSSSHAGGGGYGVPAVLSDSLSKGAVLASTVNAAAQFVSSSGAGIGGVSGFARSGLAASAGRPMHGVGGFAAAVGADKNVPDAVSAGYQISGRVMRMDEDTFDANRAASEAAAASAKSRIIQNAGSAPHAAARWFPLVASKKADVDASGTTVVPRSVQDDALNGVFAQAAAKRAGGAGAGKGAAGPAQAMPAPVPLPYGSPPGNSAQASNPVRVQRSMYGVDAGRVVITGKWSYLLESINDRMARDGGTTRPSTEQIINAMRTLTMRRVDSNERFVPFGTRNLFPCVVPGTSRTKNVHVFDCSQLSNAEYTPRDDARVCFTLDTGRLMTLMDMSTFRVEDEMVRAIDSFWHVYSMPNITYPLEVSDAVAPHVMAVVHSKHGKQHRSVVNMMSTDKQTRSYLSSSIAPTNDEPLPDQTVSGINMEDNLFALYMHLSTTGHAKLAEEVYRGGIDHPMHPLHKRAIAYDAAHEICRRDNKQPPTHAEYPEKMAKNYVRSRAKSRTALVELNKLMASPPAASELDARIASFSQHTRDFIITAIDNMGGSVGGVRASGARLTDEEREKRLRDLVDGLLCSSASNTNAHTTRSSAVSRFYNLPMDHTGRRGEKRPAAHDGGAGAKRTTHARPAPRYDGGASV